MIISITILITMVETATTKRTMMVVMLLLLLLLLLLMMMMMMLMMRRRRRRRRKKITMTTILKTTHSPLVKIKPFDASDLNRLSISGLVNNHKAPSDRSSKE